jgi:hypothetical protein
VAIYKEIAAYPRQKAEIWFTFYLEWHILLSKNWVSMVHVANKLSSMAVSLLLLTKMAFAG